MTRTEESVKRGKTREIGQECRAALCEWQPDPEWLRSEESRAEGSEGSNRIKAVLALRDQFVAILGDVTDTDEQENVIAIFYAQIRCHWILLNTQSGYQIAEGKISPDIYHQSGLLSALLDRIEPFLNPSDVSNMTQFLTQPARRAGQSASTAAPDALPFPDLRLDLAVLKRETSAARKERSLLEAELGFSDARAVVEHLKEMESRLTALEDLQFMLGNLEDTVSLVNI